MTPKPRVERAQGLEEAFILTAMLSLVAGTVWLAVNPGLLHGHFYRPSLFGATHIFTLGWISLMIQGVLVRLAPMVFGIPNCSRKLGFCVYGLWVIGGSGVAFHMFHAAWFGVWTSAVCVFAATLLLLPLHRAVWKVALGGDWIARYALAAVLHLALAGLVGMFIGLNKHLEWVAVHPYRSLAAHFYLAEAGWVTLMILGFGRRLYPPLAPKKQSDPGATKLRFLAYEIGLLGLVGSLVFAPAAIPFFTLVLGAALFAHLYRPLHRFARGEVSDRASFWASVALTFLAADVLLGLAIGVGLGDRVGLPTYRLQFAHGFVALVGWNILAITAFAMKLFPLWVWQERFQEEYGKTPVPAMQSLYSHTLQHVSGAAITLGTLICATGILMESEPAITWGTRVLAVGVLSFVANFVRMARTGMIG